MGKVKPETGWEQAENFCPWHTLSVWLRHESDAVCWQRLPLQWELGWPHSSSWLKESFQWGRLLPLEKEFSKVLFHGSILLSHKNVAMESWQILTAMHEGIGVFFYLFNVGGNYLLLDCFFIVCLFRQCWEKMQDLQSSSRADKRSTFTSSSKASGAHRGVKQGMSGLASHRLHLGASFRFVAVRTSTGRSLLGGCWNAVWHFSTKPIFGTSDEKVGISIAYLHLLLDSDCTQSARHCLKSRCFLGGAVWVLPW